MTDQQQPGSRAPKSPASGKRSSKRRLPFTPSFLIGLLLVPASAVAANFLITSTPAEPELQVQAFPEALVDYYTPRPNAASADATAPTTAPTEATDADLALACGSEGLALVAQEAAETTSDIEVAALAALRTICQEVGIPLPLPPQLPPIIQTVTVQAAAGSGVNGVTTSQRSDEDDDDHAEDEHEREHEDEDDD